MSDHTEATIRASTEEREPPHREYEAAEKQAARLRIISGWFAEQNLAELGAYLLCAADTLEQLERRAERAERERDELARWRDEAVANCAKRQCSLRDRRLAELEAERDELRAALARAEAAGMQKEGIEP